jgi:uncharacterized membrane protein YozB (DUF420 family)
MPMMERAMSASNETPARTAPSWLIPAGLIALSVLPLIGGAMRMIQFATGAQGDPTGARLLAAPIPLFLHILSSSIFFVLGAFQFSPAFRRSRPDWHRAAGRVLIPGGVLSAVTGIWMACIYPPLFGDGTAATVIRIVVGTCIVVFIALGFAAIRQRNVASHRAWMMRAYALAIAAGTQPLTLAPIIVFPELYGELGYTLGLGAGWVVNIAFAEWLIRTQRR